MYIYSALPWQRTHQRPRARVGVACPPCAGGPKERAKEAAPARGWPRRPGPGHPPQRGLLQRLCFAQGGAFQAARGTAEPPGQPAGRAHASSAIAWGSQWGRSTLGNPPARSALFHRTRRRPAALLTQVTLRASRSACALRKRKEPRAGHVSVPAPHVTLGSVIYPEACTPLGGQDGGEGTSQKFRAGRDLESSSSSSPVLRLDQVYLES
nr:uncharacterized protein LOC125632694 isoform X1 [Caretta caretta]